MSTLWEARGAKGRCIQWEDPLETAEYVNQVWLRGRGWTRTAIKRLLGEPDRRRTVLQRGIRRDRPECLYAAPRVMAVEDSGALEKYRTRGQATRKKRARRSQQAGLRDAIAQVLRKPETRTWLTKQQWRVMELLFHKDQTQQETGKRLGISQQTVSRIKIQAVGRIRAKIFISRSIKHIEES